MCTNFRNILRKLSALDVASYDVAEEKLLEMHRKNTIAKKM
jgi:hypothetical protein